MKIGKYVYHRVSRRMKCPVCGKPDWCLVSDDKAFVLCARISLGSRREYQGFGWLHTGSTFTPPKRLVKNPGSNANIENVFNVHINLSFDVRELMPLAAHLKIDIATLSNMGIGTDGSVYYTPMYDADRKIIGLKCRNLSGQKWCVKGSRLGVCYSRDFRDYQNVYICEGESDTAAMVGQGYNAIGRASATSCGTILASLLKNAMDIIIVADYDKHGRGFSSACKLAKHFDRSVDIVLQRTHKDIRAWINSGTFTPVALEHLRQPYDPERNGR